MEPRPVRKLHRIPNGLGLLIGSELRFKRVPEKKRNLD
jgi:hypothetical protein